ncbi:hypothetical protein ACSBPU_06750 [Parapusillimonas sp. JC17]|uniref:hypothetical protein n=1 Tax=Parapusillimonas sp. JC17 TaxID=3445768 RepID=UPI003F9F0888
MQAPKHAIRFASQLAIQIAKHGVRKGAANAAAKANPVLMVLEAAASVADAVDSFFQYKAAVVHRDNLKKLIPLETERLRTERETLRLEIQRVREELQQHRQTQVRLNRLVRACASNLRLAWDELENLRQADLPELDIIDKQSEQLEEAWHSFQRALAYYNESANLNG